MAKGKRRLRASGPQTAYPPRVVGEPLFLDDQTPYRRARYTTVPRDGMSCTVCTKPLKRGAAVARTPRGLRHLGCKRRPEGSASSTPVTRAPATRPTVSDVPATTPGIASIRCGNCRATHGSVDEVRACYGT